MFISELSAILTGDRMLGKDTGGLERPTREEISRLAYHRYEKRDRQDGQDVDDWLAAEQELTRHYR
jgi:hypothetical protein